MLIRKINYSLSGYTSNLRLFRSLLLVFSLKLLVVVFSLHWSNHYLCLLLLNWNNTHFFLHCLFYFYFGLFICLDDIVDWLLKLFFFILIFLRFHFIFFFLNNMLFCSSFLFIYLWSCLNLPYYILSQWSIIFMLYFLLARFLILFLFLFNFIMLSLLILFIS